MKLKTIAIALASILVLSNQSVMAAPSVGYNYLVVPANSDVFLTAPFTQQVEGNFSVTSKSGTSIFITGPLVANEFGGSKFYVRFTSGTGKGYWSTVTSNTTNELVLGNTSILSNVSVGDNFVVFPHETLATMFPDALESVSFAKSTSLINRSTEILIPNTSLVGINKPAAATYFYFNSEWRRVGAAPTANFNDTVLPPQEYFILRNRSANQLKFVSLGYTAGIPVARLLPTATQKNDITASTGFPQGVMLTHLNLGGTSAFETTTSLISRKDELLIFNNNTVGLNKPASATYFYYNGAWRKVGSSPSTSFDNEVLNPGSAILIRKAAGVAGTVSWYQPSVF